jgi:Ca2+-transporting ATPase
MHLFQSFLSKSITNSIFKTGITSNIWMIIAFVISYGFLIIGLYAPRISDWLEFEHLSAISWAIVFICVAIDITLIELVKLGVRRFMRSRF